MLAAGYEDGEVRRWSAERGQWAAPPPRPLPALRHGGSSVRCVAFSPAGELLATVGDGAVRLWSARSGRALLQLPKIAAGPALSAAFQVGPPPLPPYGVAAGFHLGQLKLPPTRIFFADSDIPDTRGRGLADPGEGMRCTTGPAPPGNSCGPWNRRLSDTPAGPAALSAEPLRCRCW